MLVFDPSSDAAIVHGVSSIYGDEAPLPDCPEDFQKFRFGVQCRVKMQTQNWQIGINHPEPPSAACSFVKMEL